MSCWRWDCVKTRKHGPCPRGRRSPCFDTAALTRGHARRLVFSLGRASQSHQNQCNSPALQRHTHSCDLTFRTTKLAVPNVTGTRGRPHRSGRTCARVGAGLSPTLPASACPTIPIDQHALTAHFRPQGCAPVWHAPVELDRPRVSSVCNPEKEVQDAMNPKRTPMSPLISTVVDDDRETGARQRH